MMKNTNVSAPDETPVIRQKTAALVTGICPPHENYTFLYAGPDVTRKTWENDVEAGAHQFRSCELHPEGTDSTFTVIEADNREEGFNAVLYYNALRRERKWNKISKAMSNIYGPNTDYADASYDDLCEDSEEEPDGTPDLDYYLSNPSYFPVISFFEILRHHNEMSPPFIPFFNQAAANALPEVKPPYWTDLSGRPVCILMDENDGSLPSNDDQLNLLQDFAHLPCVYILYIRSSSCPARNSPFEEDEPLPENGLLRDPFIGRIILSLTADHVDVTCSPEQRENYHRLLMASWMKHYRFEPLRKEELAEVTEEIIRINPEHPSEYMDKTLKLIIRHLENTGGGEERIINRDILRRLGLFNLSQTPADAVRLDQLIGLEEVKKNLRSVVNILRFNRMRKRHGQRSAEHHNVFMFLGAPGTAKTTAAKALGQMLRKENLLPRDRFISVTGSQLKGEFVGHTAPKVHALFRDYDIILIDEAYSLASNDRGHLDTFAQEALAQLVVELEEHATDKVVIFAGYGGEYVAEQDNRMKDFLSANPGIRSRINFVVNFPSYSAAEMLDIVHFMAKERGLRMTRSADAEITKYYETRVDDRSFGNGREARVFIENAERILAERYASITELPKGGVSITRSDVLHTLEYLRKKDRTNNPFRQYGII